jgi:type VI secretion system secreted protein Hcp
MSDQILMKIGENTVKGESKTKDHLEEIELMSFSHNVAMPMTNDPSNTKRTSGTAHVGEFVVSKLLDQATPVLNQKCIAGQDLGIVTITLYQNDQGTVIPLMKYTMTNTLISSVSIGGGAGGIPSETLTLNFTTIKWDYAAQKAEGAPAGTASASWDLAANAPAAAS